MKFGQYRNSELKMHELDHQNIKPHPCEICLKPFKLNALKTEHIRALHFKSKIKCEVCGKKFIRLGKYRNHAKENHADLGAEKIEEWVARIKRMRPDYEKLEWVYD